ncbi:MAG: hypothetical protein WAU68_14595 [Vitreimonas sp.]
MRGDFIAFVSANHSSDFQQTCHQCHGGPTHAALEQMNYAVHTINYEHPDDAATPLRSDAHLRSDVSRTPDVRTCAQ